VRDRLFLRIGSAFPDQVDWLRWSMSAEPSPADDKSSLVDVAGSTKGIGAVVEPPGNGGGERIQRGQIASGSLVDVVREAAGCQLIVLVPGILVTLLEAVVPSRQRQHIINAVPYALEEQLASDIETLHFALGPRSDSGVVPVAVIARELMQHWLGDLRAVGLEPDSMIPDVLALPLPDDDWVVLRDVSMLWLRQDRYNGVVIDGGEASQRLRLVFDEQADEQRPARIHWYDCRADTGVDIDLDEVDIVVDVNAESPLKLFARHYSADDAINLIQGEFSPREQMGRLLRPWKTAGILLLVAVVIAFGELLMQYFSLNATSERLATEIEQVYRDTFPAARKVVDARAQMEQKLIEFGANGAGDQGFLSLLAGISEPLLSLPGIDLRHASYQGEKLSLSLRIKDLQVLEQLKQRLVKTGGVEVDIQSAASRVYFCRCPSTDLETGVMMAYLKQLNERERMLLLLVAPLLLILLLYCGFVAAAFATCRCLA